jgi:hypothetical protein
MSELNEMIIMQKEMLRKDDLCYHTNILKEGVFVDILKNGIEEEFFAELLGKYNAGYDFEVIFFDEVTKKEKEKQFLSSNAVARKLAKQSKNNTEEAYLNIAEEAFWEGMEGVINKDEELKKILLNKINKHSKEDKKEIKKGKSFRH